MRYFQGSALRSRVEDVVSTTGVAGGFAEGDSSGGGPLSRVLDDPTGSLEMGIDALSGFGFWRWGAGVHHIGFTLGQIREVLK